MKEQKNNQILNYEEIFNHEEENEVRLKEDKESISIFNLIYYSIFGFIGLAALFASMFFKTDSPETVMIIHIALNRSGKRIHTTPQTAFPDYSCQQFKYHILKK